MLTLRLFMSPPAVMVSRPEMRLLVTGGRAFGEGAILAVEERKALYAVLAQLRPDLIIHGGARGTDRHAGRYADEHRTPCMVFPALWDGFEAIGKVKQAGPLRNGWMLRWGHPTHVLACPGDDGTDDMVSKAERRGFKLVKEFPL